MIYQIVIAYKPSDLIKEWGVRADSSHGWYYEQRGYFYDTGCKKAQAHCPSHLRTVGQEPYFNLDTKEITVTPRVYITHYPQKGEWEHFKTISDVRKSSLYKQDMS